MENEVSATSCDSPTIFDQSLPARFPSAFVTGVKEVSFSLFMTVKTVCSAPTTARLLMITIEAPTERKILDIYFNTDHVEGDAIGATPSRIAWASGLSTGLPVGTVMEFLVSLSLLQQHAIVYDFIAGAEYGDDLNPDFDPNWTFDDKTKIYICSELNGQTPYICDVLHFYIWFSFTSNIIYYRGGLYPVLIATYLMHKEDDNPSVVKDYTGNANGVLDLTSTTAASYFDATQPGICFSNANHKVTLPAFAPQGPFQGSFTVSFWIKVGVGGSGNLLSWKRTADGSTPVTAALQPNRKVLLTTIPDSGGANVASMTATPLSFEVWTLATMTFGFGGSSYLTTVTMYFSSSSATMFARTGALVALSQSDKIVIGPFTPTVCLANYRIFSPGTALVESYGSCPSSPISSGCGMIIGAPIANQCISPPCHFSCSTCVDETSKGCTGCAAGRIADGSNCLPLCYQKSNGNCESNCDPPFVVRDLPVNAYCELPCPLGVYYYYNSSCLPGCPLPFTPWPGSDLYCDFPCSATDFLDQDGNCITDCDPPLRVYEEVTDKFHCLAPCDDNKLFYPDSGACQATCSANYEESTTSFYKTCIPKTSNPNNPNKTPLKGVTSGTQTAAQALTQVTSVLASGSSIGVSAMIAGKIFSNIKYIKLGNSEELEEALTSWKTDFLSVGISPEIPEFISLKLVNDTVPYVFGRHEVSSSFLFNFWDELGLLIILSGICLALRFLEWFIIVKKKLEKFKIFSSIRIMAMNFLFTQLYNLFGDSIMFGILQIRSLDFRNGFSYLSFILTLGFLILMLVCFTWHCELIYSYSKIKGDSPTKIKEWKSKNANSTVLFEDFKDTSKVRQSFLLLLTIRDVLFSLILTTFFEYPLLESLMILGLNIAMIVFLYLRYPFESKLEGIQQCAFEVIAFAVNICVIITASMDAAEAEAVDSRKRLGKFIIIMNLGFNFGTAGLMLTKLGLLAKEAHASYRTRQKPKIKRNIRIPNNSNNIEDSHDNFVDSSFFQGKSQHLEPQTNTNSFIAKQQLLTRPSVSSIHAGSDMSHDQSQIGFADLRPENLDSPEKETMSPHATLNSLRRRNRVFRKHVLARDLPQMILPNPSNISSGQGGKNQQPSFPFLKFEAHQNSLKDVYLRNENYLRLRKMNQNQNQNSSEKDHNF